ncbi:DUF1272 domain-containing protein [Enterobacter hormaechei]|uniref:DUF1272 domain-containing protein n=1 Tax=Enterobacter TaxID=547 RepID=UPI000D6F83B6|nr:MULTISPECIES: DUF1272 domain-containing protein [Enterobacter]HDT4608142.1 DUF1272 domain-containing protein [Enterobacter hormaechei subsp. steigerwaltii]MBG0688775.1 DUF1272 domain-containing protein [Enterobacter hormaechei]MDU6845560.1 DUF1272 domain-containing protein [Enterobacter hormaechei]MDU6955666.1 DUF1272 domain-containing protein [Enterobacter hormaechei]MDY7152421.1 DUF1272 domain-containing protein [Enterobacter hormaechei]
MLELRPNCECCDKDLPPESKEAYICSFECTFCVDCVVQRLNGQCPNCGGELVRRPIRPEASLLRHPASSKRHYKH